MKKLMILAIFGILLCGLASAYYISSQGTDLVDGLNNPVDGNLSIEIWDNLTAGNLLVLQNFTDNISEGSWNVIIDNSSLLSLIRGNTYYMDYKVNGEDVDFGSDERLPLTSWVGDAINASEINATSILQNGNQVLDSSDEYLGGLSCSDTEIPKYNSSSGAWECESDDTGGSSANYTNFALTNISEVFDESLIVTKNLTVKGNNISLGSAEGDSCVYIYEDGGFNESFCWDNGYDSFSLSDDLSILGGILIASTSGLQSTGALSTKISGANLWLGNSTESNAKFQAKTDGSMIISGGAFNISSSGIISSVVPVWNHTWNQTMASELFRPQSWDNITGIPHATPSNGDTTHFSLADEVYDWVIGLGYASVSYVDTSIANLNISDYLRNDGDTGSWLILTGNLTINNNPLTLSDGQNLQWGGGSTHMDARSDTGYFRWLISNNVEMYLDSGGLAIGSPDSSEKELDVVGDINATGTGYFNNVLQNGNQVVDFTNGANYWNDTSNGMNITYTGATYATIDEPLWTANQSSYLQLSGGSMIGTINHTGIAGTNITRWINQNENIGECDNGTAIIIGNLTGVSNCG